MVRIITNLIKNAVEACESLDDPLIQVNIKKKKKNVLVSLLSEFSAIGLAAGVLAATGSSVLAWQIASRLFEITYIFNLSLWALGISSGVGLVCGFGYLASRKAIESPPINVLRNN